MKVSALILVLLGLASSALYEIAIVVPLVRQLGKPVVLVAKTILEDVPGELALSDALSAADPIKLLHFADTIEMGAKHLKARSGLLVGSIEYIGMVPIAITYAGTAIKIYHDYNDNDPNAVEFVMWAGVILGAFVIAGVMATLTGQRMERCAMIFRSAVKRHEGRVPANGAGAGADPPRANG